MRRFHQFRRVFYWEFFLVPKNPSPKNRSLICHYSIRNERHFFHGSSDVFTRSVSAETSCSIFECYCNHFLCISRRHGFPDFTHVSDGTYCLYCKFFRKTNVCILFTFYGWIPVLLWNPAYLLDVGFQLSFLATLGILVLNPFFGFFDKIILIGEDIKTTISAQLGTLPILLGVFWKVGLWSVIVNALVIWTIPIVMTLGSLAVLTGILIPPLGGNFFFLSAYRFLLFFEFIVSLFGKFPGHDYDVRSRGS